MTSQKAYGYLVKTLQFIRLEWLVNKWMRVNNRVANALVPLLVTIAVLSLISNRPGLHHPAFLLIQIPAVWFLFAMLVRKFPETREQENSTTT